MKQSELKELSVEELNEKLSAFSQELSSLKMNHAISPLENPSQLRSVRRTIARINTEITKRELQ
ncbi:50S ribosomal protein L29 [Psychroflexus planctonicus]|uniref:Large ribosomal subunit protein uL29 n=1 Tax=Psychroflexus planctonicus TaxID=1526575 RepID=A0ABQ1SEG3_9FLAO|nr:50S ribosomal protein L29 [Psychroflexus planctonicus]GGE23877.1 50S ribosomal protein L29 [Psychroflexus planctonicus]